MNRNLWSLLHNEAKFISGALILLLASCLFDVPVTRASLIGGTYKVNEVAPPGTGVKPLQTVTNPDPIVFREVANGIMSGNMPVDALITTDFTTRPVVSGVVIDSNLVPGLILAGTRYESYLFHFDPINDPNFGGAGCYPSPTSSSCPLPPVQIDFQTQILGLQLFGSGAGSPSANGHLGDGDLISPLGANYYPGPTSGSPPGTDNSPTRGLESGDSIGIYAGRTSIRLAGLSFSGQVDQVRIFVAAVPEPASLGMALIAILGIMGLGRTRSKAARS